MSNSNIDKRLKDIYKDLKEIKEKSLKKALKKLYELKKEVKAKKGRKFG